MKLAIENIVKPKSCLLAFAIPLSKEDFTRDLESGADKDFVRMIVRRQGAGIDEQQLWDVLYASFVTFITEIVREVEKLGVTVVYNLALHDLNTFHITGASIGQLHKAGVENSFIRKLSPLLNKKYDSGHAFLSAVAQHTDKNSTEDYAKIIIESAKTIFPDFNVVTLAAHWRSSTFVEDDFIDISRILCKLKNPDASWGDYVIPRLSGETNAFLKNYNPAQNQKTELKGLKNLFVKDFNKLLEGEWVPDDEAFNRMDDEGVPASVLDRLLPLKTSVFYKENDVMKEVAGLLGEQQSKLYMHVILKHSYRSIFYATGGTVPGARIVKYPLYRKYLNRKCLDNLFSGSLVKGSRVEFYDRCYTIDEIAAAFPVDYNAIFDLSICNSLLLAEAIRARCGSAAILCNKYPASLKFKLILYKHMIKWIHTHDDTWIDADIKIRKALIEKKNRRKTCFLKSIFNF